MSWLRRRRPDPPEPCGHDEVEKLLQDAAKERSEILQIAKNLTRRLDRDSLVEDLSRVLRRDL